MTTRGTHGSGSLADGVVLGVDTHLDFHVAVVLDRLGRRLGEVKVPRTTNGYRNLVSWAEGFGAVRCAGVEGTGSYGAGLARFLKTAGIAVVEIERPKRRHLRRRGKSDPIDAEKAARAALAGEAAGVPKSGDGRVEMVRALRAARRSAVKSKTQAANLLKAMLVVHSPPGPPAVLALPSMGTSGRGRPPPGGVWGILRVVTDREPSRGAAACSERR